MVGVYAAAAENGMHPTSRRPASVARPRPGAPQTRAMEFIVAILLIVSLWYLDRHSTP
jgi:hypothetical protein